MDTVQHSSAVLSRQDDVNDRLHLFVVLSQITYAVSTAIIRHYGLKPENCTMLATREYRVPDTHPPEIPVYDLPKKYVWLATFTGKKQKRSIQFMDAFTTKATQDRFFDLYIAGTQAPFANLLISHKKCLRYSIIEEGSSRFCTRQFDVNDHWTIGNRNKTDALGHPRFRTANRCWMDTENERFSSMFAIYPDSFIAGKNVVVLPDVFQKIEPFPYPDADAFLVIDMIVQARLQMSIALYIRALDYLIAEELIPRGYRTVYYKSRKFEESEELGSGIDALVEKYGSAIALKSLPDDCFFENVVYSHNVPVYYVMSSVGFFARSMGRETYTLIDICGSFDAEMRNEFYLSERNVMATKSGVVKLPCEDRFGNRTASVSQALAELSQTLDSFNAVPQ